MWTATSQADPASRFRISVLGQPAPGASSWDGSWLAAFEDKALEGRQRGVGIAPVGNHLEAGLHAIRRDIDADITAVPALEEALMRVFQQCLRKQFVGRAAGGNGSANKLGRDGGRCRIAEVGFQIGRPERVDISPMKTGFDNRVATMASSMRRRPAG